MANERIQNLTIKHMDNLWICIGCNGVYYGAMAAESCWLSHNKKMIISNGKLVPASDSLIEDFQKIQKEIEGKS